MYQVAVIGGNPWGYFKYRYRPCVFRIGFRAIASRSGLFRCAVHVRSTEKTGPVRPVCRRWSGLQELIPLYR